MSENDTPPAQNSPPGRAGDGGSDNHLNIGNLHYHPNELSELRKIAEINPELAHKVIDQRERSESREETSFRIGLGSAFILLVTLIIGTVYVVVNAGIMALICLFAAILAVALLIRVILTGEWSETNWVGHIVKALVAIAGGKVTSDNDDKPKDREKKN